jgi:hypothetical protein
MSKKFIYVNADGFSQQSDGAFETADFVDESAGVVDAGKPVKLNDDGQIDASMLGGTGLLTLSKEGVQFDTSGDAPTGTPPEGRVWWNSDDHTLNIQSDIPGTTNQVGQENWLRAFNNTGSIIAEGSVVYINGANTARPTIALAIASASLTSDRVIGVATSNIGINSLGVITTFGLVRGLTTNVDGDGGQGGNGGRIKVIRLDTLSVYHAFTGTGAVGTAGSGTTGGPGGAGGVNTYTL